MKEFVLSVLFYVLFQMCWGLQISGTVTDRSGLALPGANVWIVGSFAGTSTKTSGYFTFHHTADSAFFLRVTFLGYQEVEMVVSPGKDTVLQVILEEQLNQLNAVVVATSAYETGVSTRPVVMNSIEMATTAGSLGDINAALQTLPGTSAIGESGKLFVHGGEGSETATYIDGMLVHQPYTSNLPNTAVRGRFNPFMFKGTSFSTGGYSAEYGQALSAILELNTIDEIEQDELNLSLMTVGGDLAGSKKLKKGSVTVSANYMNLKPYMNLVPQNYAWDEEPTATGGALKWVQNTALNGQFKLYGTWSQSQLAQANGTSMSWSEAATQMVNRNFFTHAKWQGVVGAKWQLKLGGSFTHNTDFFNQSTWSKKDHLQGGFVKAVATFYQNEKTEWKFGVENNQSKYLNRYGTASVEGDSVVGFDETIRAGFVEMKHQWLPKLGMKLGARVEHSKYMNQTRWAPRSTLVYQISKNTQISAAFGWFYQNPVAELLVNQPRLQPEKSTQYTCSIQSAKKGKTLRIEGFYKQYDHLVKWGENAQVYNNKGDGYATGVDIYFKDEKTIKGGTYWISYSYLQGERNYRNYPYAAQPTFVVPHAVNVVYKHWFTSIRSYVGATLRWGSSRVYHNPNLDGFNTGLLPVNKSLDLNYTFLFREHIIVYASATNVLNYTPVFGYQFSAQPNARGHYEASPILPSANQFFFLGCFITLSQFGDKNQLDKINF